MNHIDEFTMHRFRGIKDLKLEGLGQINLLIGNNNSGKTSALEALFLFCDALNGRRWSSVASMREANGLPFLTQAEWLKWLFPQSEGHLLDNSAVINSQISLECSGSFPVKTISAHYEEFTEIVQVLQARTVEGRTTFEEREREDVNVKIDVSAVRQIKPKVNEVLEENFVFSNNRSLPLTKRQEIVALPSQLISPTSHRFGSIPSQLWTDVINAETKAETIKLLRSFDAEIQDVDIVIDSPERPTVSIKHARLGRAPLSTFGDGLRRVFTLAAAIPGVRNGLLLVDELEMAIHTRLLEKTFNWLVKSCVQNNVQLLATTHSLETVDTLLNAVGENIEIVAYRLRKDKDTVVITRFDKALLSQVRMELGLEVR